MSDANQTLRALGSGTTRYTFAAPDATLLEAFANPFADGERNRAAAAGSIHIEAPEFTTLCPMTGQPDFATIVIDYVPGKKCVESKSLKLYLMSFRNHGEFHESCVNRICNDLVALLDPERIVVEGRFAPRGGISFRPTAAWEREA